MNRWIENLQQLLPAQREAEEKRSSQKELADRYIAAGKTKVADARYASALASFNRALCLQREALGEDSVTAGHTLHEIGLCLAWLGEEDAALVALKEALYIKLNEYGPDGEETQITEAVVAELVQTQMEKENRRKKVLRRSCDDEEESSAADSSSAINTLHNSAKWEYSLDLEAEVTEDVSVLRQEKQSRRSTEAFTVDRAAEEALDQSLHDDFHYKEFTSMRRDSGSKFQTPDIVDDPEEDPSQVDAGDMTKDDSSTAQLKDIPTVMLKEGKDQEAEISEEERRRRSARSVELAEAIDDIEKSMLSTINFGPEGSVQILKDGGGETEKLSNLRAISF